MTCKTPWVTLSLLFTSLLKLERRMIAFCFGDDGCAAVVSEEVGGSSSKALAFTTTGDDDGVAWSSPAPSVIVTSLVCYVVLISSSAGCGSLFAVRQLSTQLNTHHFFLKRLRVSPDFYVGISSFRSCNLVCAALHFAFHSSS